MLVKAILRTHTHIGVQGGGGGGLQGGPGGYSPPRIFQVAIFGQETSDVGHKALDFRGIVTRSIFGPKLSIFGHPIYYCHFFCSISNAFYVYYDEYVVDMTVIEELFFCTR